MTTSVHERSGTASEDEDADARVDIQICDICGDAGYDDELAVCSRCKDSAEHIYCMVTMHDKVPLQWLCKQCELKEGKSSTRKRFAGNEPFSTPASKKQNTKELSGCSVLNEAKNVFVQDPPSKLICCESRRTFASIPSANLTEIIKPNLSSISRKERTDVLASSNVGLEKKKKFGAVEAQVHGGSTVIKNLSTSLEGRHASEARPPTLKQGEAVLLSSASLRRPSGFHKSLVSEETNIKVGSESRTARESSIRVEVNTSPKDASNHERFPSDGLHSGSKYVFPRSVSMKSGDDQPSFLLPSRPKNFTRSKSAVVRPSVCWNSDKEHHKGHPLAIREHTRWNTSHMMDSTKAKLAGPIKQTGQDRVIDYGQDSESLRYQSSRDWESPRYQSSHHRSSRDVDSPCHRSLRGPESLQHGGLNDKDGRRCYRCSEVGHIAARCKNVSSSKPAEWEASRGQASSENGIAGRQLTTEGPLGLHTSKGGGFLSESLSCNLKQADSSGTWSKQIKKESIDITETENTNEEEESPSWKSCSAPFLGACSKPSSKTSHVIRPFGKERLDRRDIVNTAVKRSQKPSDSSLVPEMQVAQVRVLDGEKGSLATSSPPLISSETGKQVSIQDITLLQGVNAENEKHLRGPQSNQVVFPNSMAQLDLEVDTSFNSYYEVKAEPCVEMLWSGGFNVVSNNCVLTYRGLQAHASTKADPRVFEAIKSLQCEIYLEESKRGVETNTWPRSLLEQPPTSNSIGVYFFPVDMACHDMWYKPLLDHLSANDLALKTNLDLFQLLIFPSQLLPQAEQCWDDRQYLWGILRRGASFKVPCTATVGV